MQVIPVVDLMGGVAVRAVAGQRDRYRPLVSPLARSSDPRAVVEGYLALHPFETLYVADLDAILGRDDNFSVLRELALSFPQTRFWLDAGGPAGVDAPNVERVIGSENLSREAPCPDLSGSPDAILSLDFGPDGAFLGPAELESAPRLWPPRVLLMTLARIGCGAGPDLAQLSEVTACAGRRDVFAAGGVRDGADLAKLQATGAAGALVASALHEGRLGQAELAALG